MMEFIIRCHYIKMCYHKNFHQILNQNQVLALFGQCYEEFIKKLIISDRCRLKTNVQKNQEQVGKIKQFNRQLQQEYQNERIPIKPLQLHVAFECFQKKKMLTGLVLSSPKVQLERQDNQNGRVFRFIQFDQSFSLRRVKIQLTKNLALHQTRVLLKMRKQL
ncbi:unnamed protein product [Paramecium octaurelia]|uniref:Uncharacterized protein n=1 Tax=Paramecium octaurelia TaxID=43137 RepID=A0A8S1V225_PAROT|nr:unnamed protein product [Paramecium octaurelia]